MSVIACTCYTVLDDKTKPFIENFMEFIRCKPKCLKHKLVKSQRDVKSLYLYGMQTRSMTGRRLRRHLNPNTHVYEDLTDAVLTISYDTTSANEDNGSADEDNGSADEDNSSDNEDNGSADEDNSSDNEDNGSANEDNGSANEDNDSVKAYSLFDDFKSYKGFKSDDEDFMSDDVDTVSIQAYSLFDDDETKSDTEDTMFDVDNSLFVSDEDYEFLINEHVLNEFCQDHETAEHSFWSSNNNWIV